MNNPAIPDLVLRCIPYGTHQTPYNLRVLLYRGGAGTKVSRASELIESGQLGQPIIDRLTLVTNIWHQLTAAHARGSSVSTIKSYYDVVRLFFAWVDSTDLPLTNATICGTLRAWTEALIHRVRIEKSLKATSAYSNALTLCTVLSGVIGVPPGQLLRMTRLRNPSKSKRAMTATADKQSLADTFEFGHALTDICNALTSEAVCGPLPIYVTLRTGQNLIIRRGLTPVQRTPGLPSEKVLVERKALRNAALLDQGDLTKRYPLIRLRMDAEIILFCAQTGMNLSQANALRRGDFRFQTERDQLIVRVYKARRKGAVIFTAFREYRNHFVRYLEWLNELFPTSSDDRLFPFQYGARIPSRTSLPQLTAVRRQCEALGLNFVGTRALRKTRVNWLLRRSRDSSLTAQMSGHLKETLLADYEEPHLQSAAAEITRFHLANDPSYAAPGPGRCIDARRLPLRAPETHERAPPPDCINPDGCLFCVHHRDILTYDYCWKLATHRYLKTLELSGYAPKSGKVAVHPVELAIDRISKKLAAIADGSEVRALWVQDSNSQIRAGNYHPNWSGFVQLLELSQ